MEYLFAMYHLTLQLKSKQINITININFILFLKRRRKESSALLVRQYYAGVRLCLSSTKRGYGKSVPNLYVLIFFSKVIIHAQVTI